MEPTRQQQPDHGELPALPWQKPRRRRPVKEPLTRERIVAAAIAILDRDGLDAVSTRRVAEDLGTGSASLYAHVASRDELLELMVDRIAGEIEVPEPDPARWQDQLRTYARHAQRVWSRHADITRASLASIPTGPNRLRVIEGLLAILRAAGFADQMAAWAVDRLQIYIDADVYEGALYAAKIKQGLEVEEYLELDPGLLHAAARRPVPDHRLHGRHDRRRQRSALRVRRRAPPRRPHGPPPGRPVRHEPRSVRRKDLYFSERSVVRAVGESR